MIGERSNPPMQDIESKMREDSRLRDLEERLDVERLSRLTETFVRIACDFWPLETMSPDRKGEVLDDVTVQAYLLFDWELCMHALWELLDHLEDAEARSAMDPYMRRLFYISLIEAWRAGLLKEEERLMETIGVAEHDQMRLISQADRGKGFLRRVWNDIEDLRYFCRWLKTTWDLVGKHRLWLPLFQIALGGAAIGGDSALIATSNVQAGSFMSILTGLSWIGIWAQKGQERLQAQE